METSDELAPHLSKNEQRTSVNARRVSRSNHLAIHKLILVTRKRHKPKHGPLGGTRVCSHVFLAVRTSCNYDAEAIHRLVIGTMFDDASRDTSFSAPFRGTREGVDEIVRLWRTLQLYTRLDLIKANVLRQCFEALDPSLWDVSSEAQTDEALEGAFSELVTCIGGVSNLKEACLDLLQKGPPKHVLDETLRMFPNADGDELIAETLNGTLSQSPILRACLWQHEGSQGVGFLRRVLNMAIRSWSNRTLRMARRGLFHSQNTKKEGD